MELSVRRATADDVPAVRGIMTDSGGGASYVWGGKYGDVNFCELVERSYLSVVVEEGGEVVGFAALDDAPALQQCGEIPGRQWERWVDETCDFSKTPGLLPFNTLWLSILISKATHADAVQSHVLDTVATTLPDTTYVLFAVPSSIGLFPPLLSTFRRLPPKGTPTTLSIFYCTRNDILPDLLIRKGLVEDFDDLMPLLQAGEGVLTSPPEEFYLDETLEEQDDSRSVLVAEDPTTHQIVGLMCMMKSLDVQSFVTKHYNTDAYNKLRSTDKDRPGPNSFQITFFYLNPEYESRAASFITPAFDQFKNVEYCVISLPHTTTEHPLLHDFSYVPLKQGLTLPNGIWLLARQSIHPVTVGNTRGEDIAVIESLLDAQTDYGQEVCLKFAEAAQNAAAAEPLEGDATPAESEVLSYSLYDSAGSLVGAVNVKVLSAGDVHNLRSNFELDHMVNFVPDGQVNYKATDISPNAPDNSHMASAKMPSLLITHFYVRPTFKNRIRLLLREVLRQSCAQLMFYCLTPLEEASQPLLVELILAMPRRMIEEEEKRQDDSEDLACLHFMSKRQLSDEKTKIYSRLVVVGASTTGLAAIYAWLKIPYLYIANIVLVSRDGIPPHPNQQDSEHWSVDTLTWLEREYILFKIGGKVRIIEGTMIDFERNDKYIVTDNGFVEPYDHLIITAGRQYTIPKDMAAKNLAKNGMFELSSLSQIHKIKQHIRESEAYEDELSNAVIYGSSKEVYSVATSLTQIGLNPSRLVVVSPEEHGEGDAVFGDGIVDAKVDKLLEGLGAKTYKGHVLERMEYDEDHNLNAVYIVNQDGGDEKKKNKVTEIPATMFVYCHEKDIDAQILSALNKRSIVFDGRVIVKYNYRTTDPNIYAIGPIAMFSGRFGPSEEFESFNPLEVGARFAETVLGFIGVEEFYESEDEDETAPPLDTTSEVTPLKQITPKALPQYKENVSMKILLPNNHYYFTCRTARFASITESCTTLTSGDARGDSLFKLCIGPNRYIESITYLGSEDIEIRNLMSLVGLPESLLNVVYAYDQSKDARGEPGLDLLQYLRSRWAYAIFHSAFTGFFAELKEKLRGHEETQRLRAVIAEHVTQKSTTDMNPSTRGQILKAATSDQSEIRRFIELEIIKFLHKHKHYLPRMYYLPDVSSFVSQCV